MRSPSFKGGVDTAVAVEKAKAELHKTQIRQLLSVLPGFGRGQGWAISALLLLLSFLSLSFSFYFYSI